MNELIGILTEYAASTIKNAGFAILTLIAGLSYQQIKKLLFRRKFKRAFGFVVEGGNQFVISLPFWTLIRNERETPRFLKISPSGQEEPYYGPTDTFSADDTKASNEVSYILTSTFPRPPVIFPDREALVFDEKTIIMIGSPIANFHARSIFQSDFFELGKDRPFIFKEKEETTASPSRTFLYSNLSNKEYYNDSGHDVAVVQRIKNPKCEDGYLYIIAASHAEGTFGAAKYLRNNWELFAKQDIGATAGVLIKVDRSNIENFLILESFPENLAG